jgi:hypothetical protein
MPARLRQDTKSGVVDVPGADGPLSNGVSQILEIQGRVEDYY